MKAVHITALIIGVLLMLGTESEYATTNLVGLVLVTYECYKLKLFSDGK